MVSHIRIAKPFASYQVETGPERSVSQIMCFVLTYSCTSHLTKRHGTVSMLSTFQYKPPQWSSGKLFASKVVGCGFQHRPDHIKVFKNGPHCLLAWHSVFVVGIWGLDNWVMGQPTFGMWQLLGLHWCSWLECGSRAWTCNKRLIRRPKRSGSSKDSCPLLKCKNNNSHVAINALHNNSVEI